MAKEQNITSVLSGRRFATVQPIAQCDPSEVLKLLEGMCSVALSAFVVSSFLRVIEALKGLSPYSGASAGEGLVGGVDVSYGDINTYNLFIGAGAKAPVPVEMHTGLIWTAGKSFSVPQIGQALNGLLPDGGI